MAKATEDGTWISSSPEIERMLNTVASADTLTGYYPDMQEAMLQKALEYYPTCRYELEVTPDFEPDRIY